MNSIKLLLSKYKWHIILTLGVTYTVLAFCFLLLWGQNLSQIYRILFFLSFVISSFVIWVGIEHVFSKQYPTIRFYIDLIGFVCFIGLSTSHANTWLRVGELFVAVISLSNAFRSWDNLKIEKENEPDKEEV